MPAMVLITGALYFFVKPSLFYDPPWLVLPANMLFIAAICFAVAYIAMKNYRATGRLQILLLGSGVLSIGLGGAVSGFVRGLPGGANLTVTIYNTGALAGSLFYFTSALILLAGISPEAGAKRKMLWLLSGYMGLVLFMGLMTVASLEGVVPVFFVQGAGPGILRQGILGTADALFIFSSLVFMWTYLKNREVFLYWYSLALALTAISLTAFFFLKAVGSPVGWAGRFAQYLGCAYFLVALKAGMCSAHARGTSLGNVLTSSLTPAEERYRALAENSPDIINRFDRDMKYIYVNHAGLRALGKEAGSVIGKTMAESGIAEPYCGLWKERIKKVFSGCMMEVEDYFPAAGGLRFFQSRCVPEYGAGGSVASVLVISRDITGHKQAEEALQHSLNRYRSYIELTGQLGWRTDADGHIVEDLPSWMEYTGQTRQEMKGWGWLEAVHPDDARPTALKWRNAVSQKSSYEAEYRLRRRDGAYRVFMARGIPLFRMDGSIREWVGTCIDITDRKASEQAIAESLREKEILLQELYHRTKNNMNVIAGLMSLHMNQAKDPSVKQVFKEAQNRIHSMSMVHGMLYKTHELSKLDLKEYLERLACFILSGYKTKDISLKCEMDAVAVSLYVAMPCGLILNELLSNSVKHAFPGRNAGGVSIRLEAGEKEIKLSYSDDGIGMSGAARAADPASLGMRLVNGLVKKQLLGDMEIMEGHGTNMVIRFDRARLNGKGTCEKKENIDC